MSDGPVVQLSVCVRDRDGRVVRDSSADLVLRTASVGKLLLLLECARSIEAGELDAATTLSREPGDLVADSGLWHLMAVDALPLGDVATLVAAVSDNLATNVLLRHVGLDRVDALRRSLGLEATRLLDRVRSSRGAGDIADPSVAWTLSTGSAAELSLLAHRIGTSAAVSPAADARVVTWLAGNTDLSVVAGAFVDRFSLDPLAHRPADHPPVALWNKTGTDAGVRADVGRVEVGGHAYAYAVVAGWDASDGDRSGEAIRRMREVGEWVVAALRADGVRPPR